MERFEIKTSTRCAGGGECVGIGLNIPGVAAIQDTKTGQTLIVSDEAFRAFIADVKAGHFDTPSQ